MHAPTTDPPEHYRQHDGNGRAPRGGWRRKRTPPPTAPARWEQGCLVPLCSAASSSSHISSSSPLVLLSPGGGGTWGTRRGATAGAAECVRPGGAAGVCLCGDGFGGRGAQAGMGRWQLTCHVTTNITQGIPTNLPTILHTASSIIKWALDPAVHVTATPGTLKTSGVCLYVCGGAFSTDPASMLYVLKGSLARSIHPSHRSLNPPILTLPPPPCPPIQTTIQTKTTGDEVRVCVSGLSGPQPSNNVEDLIAAFAPADAPFNATAPIKVCMCVLCTCVCMGALTYYFMCVHT